MDLEMMRRLHKKVNIVIVITKADTLTQSEVKRLKANILRDVEANGIQLYKFPECDSDEDDDFKRQDTEMKQSIPFAVVGSNTIFEVGGKKFRGRQYPWGVVDGENFEALCQFIQLIPLLYSFQQLKIHSTATSLNSARC
jgi:septin 4